MEGRRARLRAHLLDEIRTAALDELRRSGAAALSLREVARAAGISPAGLYRYVDGRDGLLELLISDGWASLGVAVDEALDAAEPGLLCQLDAVAAAYRRWALENPAQFGLILGTPVPGFDADEEGPTAPAVRGFGGSMIRPLARAYAAGQLTGVDDTEDQVDLWGLDPELDTVPAPLLALMLRGWARIHGLVSLEVFGHLRWTDADVATLLAAEARLIVDELT